VSETNRIMATPRRVVDPETGADMVTEGMVYGYAVDELVTEIGMSFMSSTPVCSFCKAIAWSLIDRISDRIVDELQKEGYQNTRVVDAPNPKIYYKSA